MQETESKLEKAMAEIISRFDLVIQSSNSSSILAVALGNVLVKKGIITDKELNEAIEEYEQKVEEKRQALENDKADDKDTMESGEEDTKSDS